MRIWDLPVSVLCAKHLLGEHRELHAIWTYLTTDKGGSYRKHPETLRWVGKEGSLYVRHNKEVEEMMKRGYNHQTPLVLQLKSITQFMKPKMINTVEEQIENLKSKKCNCKI